MNDTRAMPLDCRQVLGLEPGQMPRHVAIIMDGNGRWARQRDLPRIRGHAEGARVVRDVVTHCARLGLQALTLYSFSRENWKRPRDEVHFLMQLYGQYLASERGLILDNNVRLVHLGRRDQLPPEVLAQMDEVAAASRHNTGLTLCLALNYGARTEILDAVRALAGQVAAGCLRPEDITEEVFAGSLYTAGLPDPDLLIRTSGESRVSNFLLWQISYAEMHVTPVLWPDFGVEDLHAAIQDFAGRQRRFGALGDEDP